MDTFTWEENDPGFEEALGQEAEEENRTDAEWKLTGKDNYHGNAKKGKTNMEVVLNTEGTQTVETIKQMMKDCREMVVDAKAGCKTNMQIKWVLA
eukprot:15333236-Ditylum_brightwellii.AAC.1